MPAQDRVQAHPDSYLAQLRADVRAGLTAEPKSLLPKYFYDERGSELFEEITRLPEYYPTRAETAILRARAGEIAELSRCESLVELGSGTSAKTGLLLRALRESGTLREFMPFDVDPAVLADATEALTTQYPGLRIVPFVGDFERDLGEIPAAKSRRMIAFLGSTIGNLEPPARASLYRHVAGVLAGGDMFLLGTDLVKDTGRLLRAYNDSAGVTAEFNRNVLKVINRELRADFDVEEFEHVAIWDAEREWIEMRLRLVGAQVVTVGDLGLTVSFDAGEEMRTEVSAKFRPAGIRAELAGAGFRTLRFWTDPDGDFGLTLAELAGPQTASCRTGHYTSHHPVTGAPRLGTAPPGRGQRSTYASEPSRECLCGKIRTQRQDRGHRRDADLRPAASADDPGPVRGSLQRTTPPSQPPAPPALARPPCRRPLPGADPASARPRRPPQRI
jgi:L-histidine N-alpha-methyltransferase